MRLPKSLLAVLTLLTTGAASAGLVVTGAATAQAATPLPAHVFAPYFEAWTGDSPATLSQQSGAKHLTMAFIQAATKGSCTVYWNGDTSQPISSSTFGSDINTIRSNGGDVIPSFGGYTADNTGTEIADSCTDVNQIAAAYEKVITTYDVTRLDLDTEDNSLTNTAGIDRRNKAIKLVEDWAAANGRTVQFSYTLPTTTSGLADSGLAVLRNAVSNNARVDVVNLMTFDYYDGATHNMAADTQTAAQGLYNQLASLYPGKSSAQLWASIGITEMIGIDDYGAAETFTTSDATTVYNWAVSKGINELSFWALQRDNGGCPGTKGSDSCSGISQSTWQFSQTFEPFTSGGGTPSNDFSLSLGAKSGSVNQGASTTVPVTTAVTAGSAQTVALSVSGAPSGVTATVSPTSVTAGGSATLTLAASSSAPAGTYTITVTGTEGTVSHSASYSLTVNGSTPTNDFSLTLKPTSGSVNAGASTTSTISTAVVSGTAQTVNLSVSGTPAGVTATVNPTSVTAGGTATLTLTAAASTAAGTYTVTVTGTAGSTSHSAAFSLTVNGSTPPSALVNGGFETGSLSPWSGQPGDTVVASPVHSGSHAVQVTPTSSQTGEVDQTVTLSPNHSYTLTAWVQGNYAYVGVSGGASASTWASGSGWTQLTVPFTTGASGTVTVYVHGWYAQGNVYADDFAIS
jgi:hypothetical protein